MEFTREAVELAKIGEQTVLRRLRPCPRRRIEHSRSSGNQDVIEPDDGVTRLNGGSMPNGSGVPGRFSNLDAITEEAMKIAASICIYTNAQIVMEELG
jgi:ATP-dependent HslUV protease subunit HslV